MSVSENYICRAEKCTDGSKNALWPLTAAVCASLAATAAEASPGPPAGVGEVYNGDIVRARLPRANFALARAAGPVRHLVIVELVDIS